MSERLQRFLVLSGHAFLAPFQGGKGYIWNRLCIRREDNMNNGVVSLGFVGSPLPLADMRCWLWQVLRLCKGQGYGLPCSWELEQATKEQRGGSSAHRFRILWDLWDLWDRILDAVAPRRTDSGLDDTSSECSAYSSNYYHCDCPEAVPHESSVSVPTLLGCPSAICAESFCFFLVFLILTWFFPIEQTILLMIPSRCAICLHLIPPRPAVPGCTTFWVPWKMTPWWVTTRRGGVKFVAGWWPLVVAGWLFDVKPPSRLALDILWQFGCCLGIVFWSTHLFIVNRLVFWKIASLHQTGVGKNPYSYQSSHMALQQAYKEWNRKWDTVTSQIYCGDCGIRTEMSMDCMVGSMPQYGLICLIWSLIVWILCFDTKSCRYVAWLCDRCCVFCSNGKLSHSSLLIFIKELQTQAWYLVLGLPNKMHSCSIQSWSLPSVRPSDSSFQLVNGKKSSSVVSSYL